jgi:Ca2+:H+ antiporter
MTVEVETRMLLRWLLPLLLAIPLALYGSSAGWSPLLVFILAALALLPLAGLIGAATAALAERLGPTVGGLLNATFGNAPELIIGILALAHGLNDVVRASIAGSVIGNSLLVLGTSMLVGGWRYRLQQFDARSAGHYAALLAIAVVGLAIPSAAALFGGSLRGGQALPTGDQLHLLSEIVAVLLLVSYAAFLAYAVFGVHAHAPAAAGVGNPAASAGDPAAAAAELAAELDKEPDVLPEWAPAWLQPRASALAGLAWLGAATVLTAIVSEALVGAIEPSAHAVGLSTFFIGLIVLPIVGNAAEHITAVQMALRNSMDATMAITAGSAIQVALLVAPVLVLVSSPVGHPVNFIFIPLELLIFALVAGLYALVSLDGESTWLEGVLLLVFYSIVATAAFFVP